MGVRASKIGLNNIYIRESDPITYKYPNLAIISTVDLSFFSNVLRANQSLYLFVLVKCQYLLQAAVQSSGNGLKKVSCDCV